MDLIHAQVVDNCRISRVAIKLGSMKGVVAEVRQRIRDLGPGGGFVLAAVHNVQPDLPPLNIVAMAEATRKFGTCPLEV